MHQKNIIYTKIPEGCEFLLLSPDFIKQHDKLVIITPHAAAMKQMHEALMSFDEESECILFPSWDCLPYDNVSPGTYVRGTRLKTLALLAKEQATPHAVKRRVVITSVHAVQQHVLARDVLLHALLDIKKGEEIDRSLLLHFLVQQGYERVETVTDVGEFAVRGGLIDVSIAGMEEAIRMDFHGDMLETIRLFDISTQLTVGVLPEFTLYPAHEVILQTDNIVLFKKNYTALCKNAVPKNDVLWSRVTQGINYQGIEHWLPLFYEKTESFFDYIPGYTIFCDAEMGGFLEKHEEKIKKCYDARLERIHHPKNDESFYMPLPIEMLYLKATAVEEKIQEKHCILHSPYALPERDDVTLVPSNFYALPPFIEQAHHQKKHVFTLWREYLSHHTCHKIMIACHSEGSLQRLKTLCEEQEYACIKYDTFPIANNIPAGTVALFILDIEKGCKTPSFILIAEQELLGEKHYSRASAATRAKNVKHFMEEASRLSLGELVVHQDYGIGRCEGLETITAARGRHDCIRLLYDNGDKLYVPVENMDLITRYGSDDPSIPLDRLGTLGWQTRKARLKERITLAAEALLKIAAERSLRSTTPLLVQAASYEEFCAGFPYAETEDQLRTIGEVKDDLESGKPMDRLVCGDVGFGKTEIALRAAFMVVSGNGGSEKRAQVAIVTPTTLLCRQHYRNFSQRFADTPYRVAQLSRMITEKEKQANKKDLEEGKIDIIIGTHALLSSSIKCASLQLLIIDEEQHFGVAQKEKLKELRSDVHVLTLTATPIPRTLQLSLAGIRELSLIATPPVDRMVVRTYSTVFDPVVIREALLREHFRGGRSFYVCPRIEDLAELEEMLSKLVPELKILTAHGRMNPTQLEKIMNMFYEGQADILLSTTIVESGLDIPGANTLIVHRADHFGLSQLYQLRGRVGRGKIRAYAYFTLKPRHIPTPTAKKRLEIMQSLDSLGAGFTLASHDMDIRGFGNILGGEQSGHIKEVGVELYQHMLAEAVEALKQKNSVAAGDISSTGPKSPQVKLGVSVLIPATYIPDETLRMGLYKRIASLETKEAIDIFTAEMVDRFGTLPQETKDLLAVVYIKQLAIQAYIEKVEVGGKGVLLSFHNNSFPNPLGLVGFIEKHKIYMKLRADNKLFYSVDYQDTKTSVVLLQKLLKELEEVKQTNM